MASALGKRRTHHRFALGETASERRPSKHRRHENSSDYDKLCELFRAIDIHVEPEASTVKCKLSSLLVEATDDAEKERLSVFVSEVERSVRTLHQIRIESSRLANLHLLKCIESRGTIPMPTINRDFFARCVAGVGVENFAASNERRDPHLYRTIMQYRRERTAVEGYERPSIVNWSSAKDCITKAMLTDALRMIKGEYYRRTQNYIKLRFDIPTNGEFYAQYVEAYEFVDVEGPIREGATHLREFLPVKPTAANIDNDTSYFLERQYQMLRYINAHMNEEDERRRGIRAFSLLPLTTSFVPGHIAINTSVLWEMWRRVRRELGSRRRLDLDLLQEFMMTGSRGRLRFPTSPEFQAVKDAAWRKLFNAAKFETGRWRFANFITTNGYEVGVLRTRECLGRENPFLSSRAFTPQLPLDYMPSHVIGDDPGVRAMCTAAWRHPPVDDVFHARRFYRFKKIKRTKNTATTKWRRKQARRRKRRRRLRCKRRCMHGPRTWREERRAQRPRGEHPPAIGDEFTIVRCSTAEYRHLAGFNKRTYWFEALKRREEHYAAVLDQMPSFRYAATDTYWTGLRFLWGNVNFLVTFSASNAFRRWRFHNYVYTCKALNHMCERVVPVVNDGTFVGVGAFDNPRGLRGRSHPPLKGFAKEMARRATVRTIDEYNTSKKCFNCHGNLTQTAFDRRTRTAQETPPAAVVQPAPPAQTRHQARTSRNVLHCTNSDCRTFWDRDVCAALNIMLVAEALVNDRPRPEYLQRPRQ